jgi:mannose-6-phosphate isomerase-like protein (cupin superfamily)
LGERWDAVLAARDGLRIVCGEGRPARSGFFHAFHKHPDQDEMIIVKSGRVTQFLADQSQELGPGDSVYIDKDVVHGSYNDSDEPAELQVVLAPAIGDGGYVAVPVADEEPWASLR